MVRIAISQVAFDAIAASMPLGSGYEAEADANGERMIWLPPAAIVDRLKAMRGPGESYSDVILRLATGEARHRRLPAKGLTRSNGRK